MPGSDWEVGQEVVVVSTSSLRKRSRTKVASIGKVFVTTTSGSKFRIHPKEPFAYNINGTLYHAEIYDEILYRDDIRSHLLNLVSIHSKPPLKDLVAIGDILGIPRPKSFREV